MQHEEVNDYHISQECVHFFLKDPRGYGRIVTPA